jgi:CheY-like chemotaxis protein
MIQAAKILIVEDEPAVATALNEMFRIGLGCEVDLAVNGLGAFERLSRQSYALVLSDVRMPEMSGTELYLWLCEAQPGMAKRFVFVTAHAEDRHFETKLIEWGVPILAKPFTLSELLAVCEPVLAG